MTIDAPAKVNLVLRVLGKREDGFHAVETLMAPLALADRLEIGLMDGGGVDFSCSDESLPVDGTTLFVARSRPFESARDSPVECVCIWKK